MGRPPVVTKAAIGNKLKIARTAQVPRVRQRDVDDLVGVPHGRTAHYENGRAAPPHDYLVKLSALWEIPVAWFLDPEPTPLPGVAPSYNSNQPEPTNSGYTSIDLRPDLPTGDWERFIALDRVEVDAKFGRKQAFACRVGGDMLLPKIQHGDLIIFWPSTKPRPGVLSFSRHRNETPRLVVPNVDLASGDVRLFAPGTRTEVVGDLRIEAYAVGIVRNLTEGDVWTLSNVAGVRFGAS